jgi:hypothetical protein
MRREIFRGCSEHLYCFSAISDENNNLGSDQGVDLQIAGPAPAIKAGRWFVVSRFFGAMGALFRINYHNFEEKSRKKITTRRFRPRKGGCLIHGSPYCDN